jgi:hypothetical protein
MKVLSYCLLFILISFPALAQQNRFMYIQTETKQPFYVRMNGKVYSSSASGYLLLSKLQPGEYTFKAGFPKSKNGEITFHVTLTKNTNYQLKNFGDKGWGLVTPNAEVVYGNQTTQAAPSNDNSTSSSFGDMLAEVTNDSTLATHKNTAIGKPTTITAEGQTVAPAPAQTAVVKPNTVVKRSENVSPAGVDRTYTDGQDTVRVFIAGTAETVKSPTAADSTKPVVPETPQQPVAANTPEKPVTPMINSDCKVFAGEEDFLKLRKKMAAEKKDEDMIKVAKKQFKTKCFTSEDIRNLSRLFLSEESKYYFFDAAFPYVFDTHNFAALQSELSSDYYINRFKALIRK